MLFYNYLLHSFLVIEVKIGEYKSEYYGQLKNYVSLVDKEIRSKIDNKTIGILLCRNGESYVIKSTFESDLTPLIYTEYVLLDKLDEYLERNKKE